MALSTFSASNAASMFQEDDEETWTMLASSNGASDLGQRLTNLSHRWEDDQTSDGDFWNDLLQQLQSQGFRYAFTDMQKLPNKSGGNSLTNLPLAFESEAGQRHLAAAAALLGGISRDRALQVTLNTLRTIDSDGSQFKSLLGSRELLWRTLLHHHQQRLARLGVVIECLRLEQDPTTPFHTQVRDLMNSLDVLFKDEGRNRGLFRRLLTIACSPTSTPTREQLEPSKALHADQSRFIAEPNTQESEWTSFCASVVEELEMQQMRERKEALEALLVLMYARIDEGVRRADFALFLLACQSTHDFFRDSPGPTDIQRRLVQVAALICSECTALWRTFDSPSSSCWASQHPLLLDISATGNLQVNTEKEILSLKDLMFTMMQDALQRKVTTAPESLAVLSYGLLLRLAHATLQATSPEAESQKLWSSFATLGAEMVQLANDQGGAFDFLLSLLDDLTGKSSTKRSAASHQQQLYDWQFSNKKHILLLEDGNSSSSKATAADTTAYTSIAREVLAASIAAFEGSILDIHHSESCENIGMLCKIGAKVFQNNSLLCDQFWADWEVYCTGSSLGFPICKLLDSSHRMTLAALQSYSENKIPREIFVQAAAPFFQLLSTLCNKAELVENMVAALPDDLLRQALLCCRFPLSTGQEYWNSRLTLLTAIGRLTTFGNSNSCLKQLRRSLEDPSNDHARGPLVLSRLITQNDHHNDILEPVLTIMAHLLDGAPQEWAFQLAREIMVTRESQNLGLARCLSHGQTTIHSASLVMAELVEHLTAVVFNDAINEYETIIYLHGITECLLSAAGTLASSLSMEGTSITSFSFETAQTNMQSISNFLKNIRTVIQLHPSIRVQATGAEMRNEIINTLASSTGIGQAIIYYATAPVSLTLAIKLQRAIEDRSILEQVAAEADDDASDHSKFGPWEAYLSPQPRDLIQHLAKNFLEESIEKLTIEDIDLDGIMARDWAKVPDVKVPLDTAQAAIELLSKWASHIEDMLSPYVKEIQTEPRPLKDSAKDLVEEKSPYRLLSSLATTPFPCRRDYTMESVWQMAGLSNFDLLLPYLTGSLSNTEVPFDALPSSSLLDLLHACLGHVWSISDSDKVADSLLFRAVYRSSRFGQLLADAVDRAVEIGKKSGNFDTTDKSALLDGILSLRVLTSCAGSNPTVAHSLLHPKGHSIISKLVAVITQIKDIPLSSGDNLFNKDADIVKLRLATGSLAVLTALWKSVRCMTRSRTESNINRLIDEMNEHESLVTELVAIVSNYALATDLEEVIDSTTSADYARGTLVSFMALALQLLATEASHQLTGEMRNVALSNFLLRDTIPSYKFCSFEGYVRAVMISSEFKNENFHQPRKLMEVLQSFPATSTVRLTPDFVTCGNSFDVSAAAYWLAHSIDKDEDTINDFVVNLSTSYHLVNAELQMMEAWHRFCDMAVLHSSNRRQEPANSERTFEYVQHTSGALVSNLKAINNVQIENGSLMSSECKRMLFCLSNLLLLFLDMQCQQKVPGHRPSGDSLLDIVATLAESSAIVMPVASHLDQSDAGMTREQAFLPLGTTIMASVIAVLGLIEVCEVTFSVEQTSRFNDACTTCFRASSRELMIAGDHLRAFSVLRQEKNFEKSFLCHVSLLTGLLSRNRGRRVGYEKYLKSVSEIMSEFNVTEQVIREAIQCAEDEAKTISQQDPPGHTCDRLLLLQGILDFLFVIAKAENADLLVILRRPELARLLVRNPLFLMLSQGKNGSIPRGYVLAPSNAGSDTSNFKLGKVDSIHTIWITSIKVLAAAMHASSKQGERSLFVEMCLEFLEVYHRDLILSLKCCESKLTRHGLHEVACILGLVAEVCKRNVRAEFQLRHRNLCLEFVSWSSFVVASLAKFLGAAGAARELFFCIDKLHSESENFESVASTKGYLWHPLLEEGVPSAKHEAVKFSHFASRCCQRVTAGDFSASSCTTRRFSLLAKSNHGDTDLERTSRLSMTTEFATTMEGYAATCLEEALSILWRMHPASYSFQMVTASEVSHIDVMNLVQIGSIIGFHPFESSGVLATEPVEVGVKDLSFGKVVSIDTITRSWVVSSLVRGNDSNEQTWIVRAGQLAGFEDLKARKTIASYLPAPNPMTELENTSNKLSLGHLILILRWCHQESFVSGREDRDASIRRLAEQCTSLLGAEISIHDEINSQQYATVECTRKVDEQLFELFADHNYLHYLDSTVVGKQKDGRMKAVIDPNAWEAVLPQFSRRMLQYWQGKQLRDRQENEKRSMQSDTLWYTGLHRTGFSQRSAFRGFR